MTTQAMFFSAAAAAAALAVFAALRDRSRARRANLDAVGWVPWDIIQILAGILTVVAIVLAFKLG